MAPPCTASVTGSSTPQLQISKTADLQTVAVGGTIEYTVTVINGGSVPADGTVIGDPIPEGIASQLWTCRTSAGAVCAGIGSGAISDTITSLPVGGSVVYTVTAKVSFTAPKVITNVATITPSAGGNCTPCTASAATAVQQSSTPTPVPGLSQWGMGSMLLLIPMVVGLFPSRRSIACCFSSEARS
ncbi:putative repeat protein (TIGR01451 family) [Comamonas odontotermitis]|uniref:Repeat protein (TIGR01451 family) n=2 Tax=Comamonas odontotermitis TaxID=379895 RepID=A0ABR6RLK8_9BURK|nr:putative repeat protein (TIGR01451 family) [Comamonas odontotermitis]